MELEKRHNLLPEFDPALLVIVLPLPKGRGKFGQATYVTLFHKSWPHLEVA